MQYDGRKLKIDVFGKSHGPEVGFLAAGLPAGFPIDLNELSAFTSRRQGGNTYSTARIEKDHPLWCEGMDRGVLTGKPLKAVLQNTNVRPSDYHFDETPRPGHADYTAAVRYHGEADLSGGGSFSGRLTAPLVLLGGIAMQILKEMGICIAAHIGQIGPVSDSAIDPTDPSPVFGIKNKNFAVVNQAAGAVMLETILRAKESGDSLGGIVELFALGLEPTIGGPLFEGVECTLSQLIFSIPAVKGLSFGDGFATASLLGSQNNDEFYFDEEGKVTTKTNHAGGLLGGIPTGMPLHLNVAFKPTPSIGKTQHTVNLKTGTETSISIGGRHDPCIVPRAVVCVESAVAIGLLDLLL